MRKIFTLSVIFVFLIYDNACAQWEQTKGPYAARTTAMTTVGNNIYAANRDNGATDGRVYRSSDLGQEWVAADNGIGSAYVLQFANIGDTIIAASANVFSVYRTINQGNAWTQALGLFATSLSVEAIGNTFWCGTDGGGIFRSIDYGLTFQPMNTGVLQNAGTVIVYDIEYINGNILLATEGGGGSARLYRSSNNGASWEFANTGLPLGTNPHKFAVNGNTIFVSCTGDFAQYDYGLYRSNDNGTTWEECNNGIPEIVNGNTGEIWSNNGVVYVSTTFPDNSPKIYKSTDNGNSFSPASTGLHNNNQQAFAYTAAGGYIFAGMGWYASVYRSADEGANWHEARRGLANATVYSLMEEGGKVYAGTQQGLFYTTDNGDNWTEMENGLPFGLPITCMENNGNSIFLGTDQYGVTRSLDNGNTWTQVNNGLSATFAHFTEDLLYYNNVLYAATWDGVYKTTDNGNNWIAINNGLPTEFGGSIVTVNSIMQQDGVLYIGTVLEGIYQSSNGGASWVPVNTGLSTAARTVRDIVQAGGALYAATDDGVYKSSNAGNQWNLSLPGGNYRRIYAANNIVYTSQYGPTVLTGFSMYRTSDAGASWQALNAGMFPNARVMCFLFSGGGLFGGTDTRSVWRIPGSVVPVALNDFNGTHLAQGNRLYWSTSQEQDNAGFEMQRSVNGLDFSNIHFIQARATGGNSTTALHYYWLDNNLDRNRKGYWYRLNQLNTSGQHTFSKIIYIPQTSLPSSLLSIYPNPAANELHLEMDNKVAWQATLLIYDASGRLVQQEQLSLPVQAKNIHVNISCLSKGMYSLELCIRDQDTIIKKQFYKL
ncbi:MAG: T9SS type A sorting domain-containing protein [Ferruginibacter sp.]